MINAGPSGSDGVSSILLAAPGYDDELDLWAGPVFALLESSVLAAQAPDRIGVVCFSPEYKTPDGTTFAGFGHMHSVPRLESWVSSSPDDGNGQITSSRTYIRNDDRTDADVGGNSDKDDDQEEGRCPLSTEEVAAGGAWQRRTPHATINVLRADQLEKAESKRNTPRLYDRNIRVLMEIGNDELTTALEKERNLP